MPVMVQRLPKKPVVSLYDFSSISVVGDALTGATINYPSGITPGDCVVAFISMVTDASGVGGVPSAPSGWELLDSSATSGNNFSVFKKTYAAGDGSSVLFGFPSSRRWGYNMSLFVFRAAKYSGIALRGNTFKGSTSSSTTTTSVSGVSLATADVPAILLSLCSYFRAGATLNTPPTGFDEKVDASISAASTRFNMQTASINNYTAALASSTLTVTHATAGVSRYGAVLYIPTNT